MNTGSSTHNSDNADSHGANGQRFRLASLAADPAPGCRRGCSGCFHRMSCRLARVMVLAHQAGEPAGLETRSLVAGDTVYRTGDRHNGLYAIKSGSAKSSLIGMSGEESVLVFDLPGAVLGIDSVGTDSYASTVTVLERSVVCNLPAQQLEYYIRRVPGIMHWLLDLSGRLFKDYQGHLIMLGSMRAEARLCRFLLDQSRQYQVRGGAAHDFNLPMSRQDISSYLGLALETVSRIFARLHRDAVVEVDRRRIRIRNADLLERLASASGNHSAASCRAEAEMPPAEAVTG